MISKSNFPPVRAGGRPALRPPTVCRKRPPVDGRASARSQHNKRCRPGKERRRKLSPRMPTAPGCRPSKGDNFPSYGAPGAMAAPPTSWGPPWPPPNGLLRPHCAPPGGLPIPACKQCREPPKAAGRQRRGRSPWGPGAAGPAVGGETPLWGLFRSLERKPGRSNKINRLQGGVFT